jgi:hypothetical protein
MIYTVEESLQNFKALIIFPDKSKQVSKKTYYNRTYERYQFERVLEDAIELLDYRLSDCKVDRLYL